MCREPPTLVRVAHSEASKPATVDIFRNFCYRDDIIQAQLIDEPGTAISCLHLIGQTEIISD